mgnify:CR=1 FL=1|tara:strand:- start:12 stop:617 length:606 start_codon:yes stop_codon:yes gene_type:complete
MELNLKIVILLFSYLLGSFPTGFLFGKYLKNIDLRKIGSGSTGATNVLRNIGKWPALFVFIIDVLKGFIAVKIAHIFITESIFEVLAGTLAVSGHIWSIWLNGKGGKAVATGLGIFVALSWQVGLASLGIFLMVLSLSKFVSLSSITASMFLPVFMFAYLGKLIHPYFLFSVLVAIIIISKHKANIYRLIKGIEPRINSKS